jgi:hypothetical protein
LNALVPISAPLLPLLPHFQARPPPPVLPSPRISSRPRLDGARYTTSLTFSPCIPYPTSSTSISHDLRCAPFPLSLKPLYHAFLNAAICGMDLSRYSSHTLLFSHSVSAPETFTFPGTKLEQIHCLPTARLTLYWKPPSRVILFKVRQLNPMVQDFVVVLHQHMIARLWFPGVEFDNASPLNQGRTGSPYYIPSSANALINHPSKGSAHKQPNSLLS